VKMVLIALLDHLMQRAIRETSSAHQRA
jgi:hypothetical protein